MYIATTSAFSYVVIHFWNEKKNGIRTYSCDIIINILILMFSLITGLRTLHSDRHTGHVTGSQRNRSRLYICH